jgi:hypothetical protein
VSVRYAWLNDWVEPSLNRLKGESSRWFGYLQSLPENIVDLPMFWSLEDVGEQHLHDGSEGLAWLRGTEIEKQMIRQVGNTLEALVSFKVTYQLITRSTIIIFI